MKKGMDDGLIGLTQYSKIPTFQLSIGTLVDQFAESHPPDLVQEVFRISIPREIDDEGLPLHGIDIHKTPETAVLAIIAVVPQNE